MKVESELTVIDLENNSQSVLSLQKNSTIKSAFSTVNVEDEVDTLQDVSMNIFMRDFKDNFGMQGIRYVFRHDIHWIRRLIWVLIVIGGLVYSTMNIRQNALLYFSYPTTIHATIVSPDKTDFPHITLCNTNVFQATQLTSEIKTALKGMFHFKVCDCLEENYTEFNNINVTEALYMGAYNFANAYCTYAKVACPFGSIVPRMTDLGVCGTFEASKFERTKHQTIPGTFGGLSYISYNNPLDWSPGPWMSYSGWILIAHDKDEEPVLAEYGMPILVGVKNEILVEKRSNKLLGPPYGNCASRQLKYFSKYSRKACLYECKIEHVRETCRCLTPDMATIVNISEQCSMSEWAHCNYLQFYDHEGPLFNPSVDCDCPLECEYTTYHLSTSYIKGSDQAFDSWNFDNIDMRQHGYHINVFYRDLQYEVKKEISTFNLDQFFSSAGGAAGLMLGCSIATIAEFVDFVGILLYSYILRRGRTEVKNISHA